MKTIPISIHTKHIPILTSEYSLELRLRRVSVAALAVLVCVYIYFVTASVFHVMERKTALMEADSLSGAVAELEQNFFTNTELLTLERGSELGLVPVTNTTYMREEQSVVGRAPETLY